MQFINKDVEFLGVCPSDEAEMLIHVEKCGRRCYKSEHKIDLDNRSYEKFYRMLLNHGHVSAIEHSNIVLEFEFQTDDAFDVAYWSFLQCVSSSSNFFRIIPIPQLKTIIVSGNIRAWVEFFNINWSFVMYTETGEFLTEEYPIVFSGLPEAIEKNAGNIEAASDWLDDERQWIESVDLRIIPLEEQLENFPFFDKFDIPVLTFVAYTDRGISHEIVRHRVLSYSQESTRYVNYSSRGLQFINFPFPDEFKERYESTLTIIEDLYNDMIAKGVKPQFARNILPHSTKTEIAMSGRLSGWDHFVELRTSAAAHPDIRPIGEFVKDVVSELREKYKDEDDTEEQDGREVNV